MPAAGRAGGRRPDRAGLRCEVVVDWAGPRRRNGRGAGTLISTRLAPRRYRVPERRRRGRRRATCRRAPRRRGPALSGPDRPEGRRRSSARRPGGRHRRLAGRRKRRQRQVRRSGSRGLHRCVSRTTVNPTDSELPRAATKVGHMSLPAQMRLGGICRSAVICVVASAIETRKGRGPVQDIRAINAHPRALFLQVTHSA